MFFSDRPATCTCTDAVYRRKDETGETCRHIRAVVALGLHQTDAEFEADELDRRREALDAAFADLDATFTRHMREDGMTDAEIERVRSGAPV